MSWTYLFSFRASFISDMSSSRWGHIDGAEGTIINVSAVKSKNRIKLRCRNAANGKQTKEPCLTPYRAIES